MTLTDGGAQWGSTTLKKWANLPSNYDRHFVAHECVELAALHHILWIRCLNIHIQNSMSLSNHHWKFVPVGIKRIQNLTKDIRATRNPAIFRDADVVFIEKPKDHILMLYYCDTALYFLIASNIILRYLPRNFLPATVPIERRTERAVLKFEAISERGVNLKGNFRVQVRWVPSVPVRQRNWPWRACFYFRSRY